jgi:regulator of sirC expression with transglutaminase-like and TPR domain
MENSAINFALMNGFSSIQALVQLIDDPDESIYEHVRGKILSIGKPALPYLESPWEKRYNQFLFQSRVEKLIYEIQFDETKLSLTKWLDCPEKDLLEGSLIISKYVNPTLCESEIRRSIADIRRDIWLELNDYQTSFEQIKIFNKIFFGVHGFQYNMLNANPEEILLDEVMRRKVGHPIVLSVIYSYIALSLDLPVYGVDFSEHFILAFMDEHKSRFLINDQNEFGVLFYLNIMTKGNIQDVKAIESFIVNNQLKRERKYFEPCSHSTILKKMIVYLRESYLRLGYGSKVQELTILQELFVRE